MICYIAGEVQLVEHGFVYLSRNIYVYALITPEENMNL